MNNYWILHQYTEKNHKYFCSLSYDDIMKYINSFDDVERIEEFFYRSNDIYFKIHIGEGLEYGK